MMRSFRSLLVSLLLVFGLAIAQNQEGSGAPSGAAGDRTEEAAQDEVPLPPEAEEEEPLQADEGAPAEEQDETTQESPPPEPAADEVEDVDGAEAEEAAGGAADGAQQPGEVDAAADEEAGMTAQQDLLTALRANPDFSMFADALERSGLATTLQQEAPFTILAPTNQAFQQAGIDLSAFDQQALSDLVRNHVVQGFVSADQLTTGSVATMAGNQYGFTPEGGQAAAEAQTEEDQVAGGGAADQTEDEQVQATEEQAQAEGQEPGEMMAPEDQPEDQAEDAADAAASAEEAPDLTTGEADITHEGVQAGGGIIYGIDTVLMPTAQEGAVEESSDPNVPWGADEAAPDEEEQDVVGDGPDAADDSGAAGADGEEGDNDDDELEDDQQ